MNETDDISTIKSEIAGDLLVAKIALDYDKTGKLDKELTKKYITEIF